jgi:hypothetical protein
MMCSANVQDPETIISPSLRAALTPVAGTSPLLPSSSPLPEVEGDKKTKAPLLWLETSRHIDTIVLSKSKRDQIKDCMESYLREWAASELGVMFRIDNSPKAEDEFMNFRKIKRSDLTDRTVITLHTSMIEEMKFHSFYVVNIKDQVVSTACTYVSRHVSDDQHELYNPATARLIIAFFSMMEYFLPNAVEFKYGYPTVFGDLGVLGDCVPDDDAIRISRDISADVKRFCSRWYHSRNGVGGKADKVKKARSGPY